MERKENEPLPRDPEMWEQVRLLRGARLAREEMAKRAAQAAEATSPLRVRVEQPGGKGVCITHVEFGGLEWTREIIERMFPGLPPPVAFECIDCGFVAVVPDQPEECECGNLDDWHWLDEDDLREALARVSGGPAPETRLYECVVCDIIVDAAECPTLCDECGGWEFRTPPLNRWLRSKD